MAAAATRRCCGSARFPRSGPAGNDHRARRPAGHQPARGHHPPDDPPGRNIPLGRLQVLRPVAQPPSPRWPADVRIDVVRVRFTPGRGRFYGPPAAAQVGRRRPRPGRPRQPGLPRSRRRLVRGAPEQPDGAGRHGGRDGDRPVPRRGRRHLRRPAGGRAHPGRRSRCGPEPTSASARRSTRPTAARSCRWPTRSTTASTTPRRDQSLTDERARPVDRGPVRAGLRDGAGHGRRLVEGPGGQAAGARRTAAERHPGRRRAPARAGHGRARPAP